MIPDGLELYKNSKGAGCLSAPFGFQEKGQKQLFRPFNFFVGSPTPQSLPHQSAASSVFGDQFQNTVRSTHKGKRGANGDA